MNTSVDSELRDICGDAIKLIRPQIDKISSYEWCGSTELERFEFVKRAAVVRQFEAAKASMLLVESGHAAIGVSMLRPAFEELVWIHYLSSIGSQANDLVRLLTAKELRETFDAQNDYLGQRTMRELGFTKRLCLAINKNVKDPHVRLKEFGQASGWRQGSVQPSMSFVCDKVQRTSQYRYIYQATSRSVHFSPYELQRRVWGEYGRVSIGSNNFEGYWSEFLLSWAFRFLIETLIFAGFTDEIEARQREGTDEMIRVIEGLRPVQILTAEELAAWDEPNRKTLGI